MGRPRAGSPRRKSDVAFQPGRRMMRAVALAALLLAAGPAHADLVAVSMGITFDTATSYTQDMVMQFTGNDASQVRTQADVNHDGTVSADEAVAVGEQMHKNMLNSTNPTMDGKAPSTFSYDMPLFDGLYGPTSATGPITVSAQETLHYSVAAADRHTLLSPGSPAGQDSASGTATIIILAPAGYAIESIGGFPGTVAIASDRASAEGTVTASDMSGHDQTVVLVKSGLASKGSPGIEAALAVAGLVAAVAILRRRL
jgi:hypothetical protein